MSDLSQESDLSEAYIAHQRTIWGLCYRMTGSASDAEDLVQETFARALDRPPRDTSRDWRPWLMRVATNLSRDHLRRRQAAPYIGPWLPEPIDTSDWPEEERAYEPPSTENNYALLESVSYAFLVALEQLNPNQRAVLLLRDVFEYSAAETAEALDLQESNVRQIHRRARATMADYDANRVPFNDALRARTGDVLSRFLLHMVQRDPAAMEKLLAEDVRVLNDGGGRFFAARRPVTGVRRVARFHVRLLRDAQPEVELRELNGLPAFVGRNEDPRPGYAPEFASLGGLDRDGRLILLSTIIAPGKLDALRVRG